MVFHELVLKKIVIGKWKEIKYGTPLCNAHFNYDE